LLHQHRSSTYDLNGNRTSDVSYGNKVATTGGNPVITGYDEAGNAIYGTEPTGYVKTTGWTTAAYHYDALNRLTSVERDGTQVDSRQDDAAGRVVKSGPGAGLPTAYTTALNAGIAADQQIGMEIRVNRYDAGGKMIHQKVLSSDGTAKSDTDYTSFDAAGNVLGYNVSNHEGKSADGHVMPRSRLQHLLYLGRKIQPKLLPIFLDMLMESSSCCHTSASL
jgi:uncharacterized protein RhaS with RHS repeats